MAKWQKLYLWIVLYCFDTDIIGIKIGILYNVTIFLLLFSSAHLYLFYSYLWNNQQPAYAHLKSLIQFNRLLKCKKKNILLEFTQQTKNRYFWRYFSASLFTVNLALNHKYCIIEKKKHTQIYPKNTDLRCRLSTYIWCAIRHTHISPICYRSINSILHFLEIFRKPEIQKEQIETI